MIQRYLTYEIVFASAHNGNFCSGKHLCWFRYQWNQTCSLSSSTPVTENHRKGQKKLPSPCTRSGSQLHRCKCRGNTTDFKGNTTPDLHRAQRLAPALFAPAQHTSETQEQELWKLQPRAPSHRRGGCRWTRSSTEPRVTCKRPSLWSPPPTASSDTCTCTWVTSSLSDKF